LRKLITYLLILAPIVFASCSDDWESSRTVDKLTAQDWSLYMYVDGVENETVSMVETTYIFKPDGEFIQHRSEDQEISSTWELKEDNNYIRIASSVFKIRTLTNRILTLEYGQDVLYFLPEED